MSNGYCIHYARTNFYNSYTLHYTQTQTQTHSNSNTRTRDNVLRLVTTTKLEPFSLFTLCSIPFWFHSLLFFPLLYAAFIRSITLISAYSCDRMLLLLLLLLLFIFFTLLKCIITCISKPSTHKNIYYSLVSIFSSLLLKILPLLFLQKGDCDEIEGSTKLNFSYVLCAAAATMLTIYCIYFWKLKWRATTEYASHRHHYLLALFLYLSLALSLVCCFYFKQERNNFSRNFFPF